MSTRTYNLGLIKPELTDAADITSYNENWEIVDRELTNRTNPMSMGGHKITDVADPELRSDVATRGFVEDFSIEGSTYVAVDENHDGNIVLRPYVADVDDFAVESEQYPGCYYRMVDGEQEWVNPPNIGGREFRTAEKISTSGGWKPIYKQVFKINCEPEASGKLVNNCVVTQFIARSQSFMLPRTLANNGYEQNIDVWRDGSYRYKQGANVADETFHIELWYYKL